MSRFTKTARHRAYLLRSWDEKGRPELSGVWRFSLEDPQTGEHRGFADLAALVAFLKAEMSK